MSGARSRDRIRIQGVSAHGFHGVLESERQRGQTFLVDAILELDPDAAIADSDDLSRTVDYAEVTAAIVAEITGAPLNLIETLAERIAAACLAFPVVVATEITVHKPEAPIPAVFGDVAVTIRRPR